MEAPASRLLPPLLLLLLLQLRDAAPGPLLRSSRWHGDVTDGALRAEEAELDGDLARGLESGDGGSHWTIVHDKLVAPEPFPEEDDAEEQYSPPSNGTDAGLYNEGFYEGDVLLKPEVKNAVSDPALLWPHGAIVYKTDEQIGCPESAQCEILMKAIEHYHRNTCIRFKQWSGEANYVRLFFNPESGACWSPVGRQGGEQLLSLGERCWYLGIVIHELGHAVGFWHEMNRPDRDDWINIFWHNILPGFGAAFAKHANESVDTLGEQFDYKSIMMYGEYAFSKDNVSPTIAPKVAGTVIGPIWKKSRLSDSDLRRIHKLYRCNGHHVKSGFPYDIQCNFNQDACGFNNAGSAAWEQQSVNATDGYVYSSSTSPGHLMSINFHPLSESDPRGPIGCVRFWYNVPRNGYLKLYQIYMRRVTQLTSGMVKQVLLWESDTRTTTAEWVHVEVPLYVTRSFRLIFTSLSNGQNPVAMDQFELHYSRCSTFQSINRKYSEKKSSFKNTVLSHSPPTKTPTHNLKPKISIIFTQKPLIFSGKSSIIPTVKAPSIIKTLQSLNIKTS
ncbi:meprin A subunit beta-like [Schistocerca gregaria]|uniref:meprin A subunit beta-like n=1 Tax=Schistocerca gregaria TaxID=7010 RepID=UPI00211EBD81|nr:meprin A subunit beta-like [Schistocerca gregaria]